MSLTLSTADTGRRDNSSQLVYRLTGCATSSSRIEDEGRLDPRNMVFAHDVSTPGIVLENDQVKVSACLVRHPLVRQAYAYRFDARDRSVVISGDTAYAPELGEFAKGADVLVHEQRFDGDIECWCGGTAWCGETLCESTDSF